MQDWKFQGKGAKMITILLFIGVEVHERDIVKKTFKKKH